MIKFTDLKTDHWILLLECEEASVTLGGKMSARNLTKKRAGMLKDLEAVGLIRDVGKEGEPAIIMTDYGLQTTANLRSANKKLDCYL